MKIAIIDYGMGNIHSVAKALQICGAKPLVTNSPADIASSEKAVLPGVGAFDDAMEELRKRGLLQAIRAYVDEKKPLLGICLGMQLLFEKSSEAQGKAGLSILEGEVLKFNPQSGQKVPHMGWNNLEIRRNDCPLLKGLEREAQVYFCHSYYPKPVKQDIVAAVTDYGLDFASFVWKDNVYGAQFHPEKSQKTGLRIIKNFVDI